MSEIIILELLNNYVHRLTLENLHIGADFHKINPARTLMQKHAKKLQKPQSRSSIPL